MAFPFRVNIFELDSHWNCKFVSEIETDSKKQEKLKKIAVKMKKISVKEEDNEIDEAMIIGGLIDTYSDTISNSFVDSTSDCSCMASHSCDCHNNCD